MNETAWYRRNDGLVVDVEMFVEDERWYAKMSNDQATISVGERVCDCGEETQEITIPASPWCLEVSEFGKRYRPVASPPKLGETKDA